MITVNGREVDWETGLTVSGLIKKLNFIFPQIFVTINGTLIKKDDYDETPVSDGDKVEIIHMIAGG
ncbi:MAG: sulfur carrier protein ThiS [Planctomycetota bacterium]|jgi:thiamine biosynthesis protein ThiS